MLKLHIECHLLRRSSWFIAMIMMVFICTNSMAQFPDFPPDTVSRSMDSKQMLWQLGIELPNLPSKLQDLNAPTDARPANPNAPEGNWTDDAGNIISRSSFGLWNNYSDTHNGFFPGGDSLRLGNYTPLNLFRLKDGNIISSPEEWWTKRRPEILADAQENLFGVLPPKDIWPTIKWTDDVLEGGTGSTAYIQKNIMGIIDISRYPSIKNRPIIQATLRTPVVAAGSVPVMIVYGGNIETYWNYCISQGWGVCIFNPNLLQPDNGSSLTSYLIGLINKGNWRKPSDWGTISAWSWGVSRLLDHLEADPSVDSRQVAVTGHSRYGKAALATMAFDERFFIGFPSDAGSLGTSMYRRHWGQDLENVGWDQEYHWMAGNFYNFMGPLQADTYLPRKVELLTVDAQAMLALCAPRPMFVNGGNKSTWSDPFGEYLAEKEATPVYELLGLTGLVMNDEKPVLDKAYIDGDLGYRYHNGGHTDAPDWPSFWDFARKYVDLSVVNVSPLSKAVSSGVGDSIMISIHADTIWSAKVDVDWVVLEDSLGHGNFDLMAHISDSNAADSARSGNISIAAPGLKDQVVSINQNPKAPSLVLSTTNIELENLECQSNFEINSNAAWTITSNVDWLTSSVLGGINSSKISLKAAANSLASSRSGIVNISSSGLESKEILVTQRGAAPLLSLFSNGFAPGLTGLQLEKDANSSATFFINTNSIPSISAEDDWLTVTSQKAFGTFYNISVTAEENPSNSPRQSHLNISVPNLEPKQIEINQYAGVTPVITLDTLNESKVEISTDFVTKAKDSSTDLLQIILKEEGRHFVKLMNSSGRLIDSFWSDSQQTLLPISNLSKGTYLVLVKKDKRMGVIRFIK